MRRARASGNKTHGIEIAGVFTDGQLEDGGRVREWLVSLLLVGKIVNASAFTEEYEGFQYRCRRLSGRSHSRRRVTLTDGAFMLLQAGH